MYILKENGREWGKAHTKFEAENAKRDREKLNELIDQESNVTVEKIGQS
ncbi:MAG: hypothetical protein ACOCRO_07390 [Halanaerobiales bacterium]